MLKVACCWCNNCADTSGDFLGVRHRGLTMYKLSITQEWNQYEEIGEHFFHEKPTFEQVSRCIVKFRKTISKDQYKDIIDLKAVVLPDSECNEVGEVLKIYKIEVE